MDSILYYLRHARVGRKGAEAGIARLDGAAADGLASGYQGSFAFLGFEFGWAWPCLNGGYWLTEGFLTPLMDTNRDTERAYQGEDEH